ncbi:MAG: M18 family aminopeptidase [Clostridia bacterium]|nr:M18 family aminopeptidase [Clostridia bacterium]
MDQTKALLDFIAASPTCFHACDNLAKMFADAGCRELTETDFEPLEPGKGYFVRRNGSSIIAFRTPKEKLKGFMIAASHSDSPTYKIKDAAEMQGAGMYIRLNTERYGGMIPSTWFDRPLSVAGRLLCKGEGGMIRSVLVNVDRDLVMIPNVAPHMTRIADPNPAVDLVPLYGDMAAKDTFFSVVAEAAGVKKEDILSSDLFLYNRMPGTVWGAHNEFISSPKLDDLQCAYSSAAAFCEGESMDNAMPVCAVFDNEEVGSQTKQGAASTFLSDILRRVNLALGGSEADYLSAVAGSFMVSADNAHAVHPNHPELADPTHRPEMNKGIVIKHNAAQHYTTDAVSAAVFETICTHAEVPTQHFFNRSDMGGGSTLGNISGTQVSLNTVDIGMAQLAMHSSYETAGAKDTDYLVSAMKALYAARLIPSSDGYQVIFA